jgi:hypothetical protein
MTFFVWSVFPLIGQDEVVNKDEELWRKGDAYAVRTTYSRKDQVILTRTVVFHGKDVFQTSYRFQLDGALVIEEFRRESPVHNFREVRAEALHEIGCYVVEYDLDFDRRIDLLLLEKRIDANVAEGYLADESGTWQPLPSELISEAKTKAKEPRDESGIVVDLVMKLTDSRERQ